MSRQDSTLEHLVDILGFKVEVMGQMLLVSTLMAVLAMTVVAVLIAGAERGRLRSSLLVMLSVSALLFVFGTMLDACISPGMKRNTVLAQASAVQIRGLLMLSDVVVWALLLGTVLLFVAIGGLGFVYSRRVGLWTLSAASTILAVFVVCCFYLDSVMRH